MRVAQYRRGLALTGGDPAITPSPTSPTPSVLHWPHDNNSNVPHGVSFVEDSADVPSAEFIVEPLSIERVSLNIVRQIFWLKVLTFSRVDSATQDQKEKKTILSNPILQIASA